MSRVERTIRQTVDIALNLYLYFQKYKVYKSLQSCEPELTETQVNKGPCPQHLHFFGLFQAISVQSQTVIYGTETSSKYN